MRGKVCAVFGCSNYEVEKNAWSFFRFPRDKNMCDLWVLKCHRSDLDKVYKKEGTLRLYKNYKICSDHFQASDFKNPRLYSQGLEAYIRHDIGVTAVPGSTSSTTEFHLPAAHEFQDLVSDHKRNIKISNLELMNYFVFRKSEIDGAPVSNYRSLCDSGYRLFNDRFIEFVKCCVQHNEVFFKWQVRSEFTKIKKYNLNILLNKSGNIEGAECECVAGAGPKASCKHIAAVCYALEHFSESGEIKCVQMCTQLLQTYHQPASAKKTISPIKVEHLPLAPDSQLPCHEVRPSSGINQSGYEDYVHLLVQNSHHKLTFSHALKKRKVSVEGVLHDHLYDASCLTSYAENLVAADEGKRAQVEKDTRDQWKEAIWLQERKYRLTASTFGRICHTKDPEKLARQLLKPSEFLNNNMRWGLQMENLARLRFQELTDYNVKKCGLIIHPDKHYLAASCDGLIGDDAILELKGLPSQKHSKVCVSAVPYLEMVGNNVSLKRKHNYFYQVQGQLYVTGRQYCLFVVYTAVDMLIVEVEKDNMFITEMSFELDNFYKQYYVPALLS